MQIAIKLTLLLNCIYLTLLIAFLSLVHSYILFPFCSIPGLSNTEFCHAIHSATASSPTSSNHILCWLPGTSSHTLCNTNATSSRLTDAIRDEFVRLSDLYKSTSDTPQIVTDIGDAVYAIDDLIILVRNSDIKHKAAIVETLKFITVAGKQSSHSLHRYASRVSSAVKMYVVPLFSLRFDTDLSFSIVASASHTAHLIDIDESYKGQAKSLLCLVACPLYQCADSAQGSFLNTILIIQSSINVLSEYNSETARSITVLEEHIRAVVDLIGDESHEVVEEIGELLGRMWTKLGGNRDRLAQMNSRAGALSKVGHHAGSMRKFVGNVYQALTGLQESTDALREVATEPLLLSGALPQSIVLAQLSDGCQALETSLMGPRNMGIFPTLSAGGPRFET